MPAEPATPLLFVLEQGRDRPLDMALPEGGADLRDLGVKLAFNAAEIRLQWQGFGPTAFVLPGARQLRTGRWTTAEVEARLSWAGRDWSFLVGSIRGEGPIPPRGVELNNHRGGHPVDAVALVEQGPDRGNFYRFRSVPSDIVQGVAIRGDATDDGLTLSVKVATHAPEVRRNSKKVKRGQDVRLTAGQRLHIAASATHDAITLHIIGR